MKTLTIIYLALCSSVIAADTASTQIDQLIGKQLAAQNLKPNAPASDSEFLRRTFLSIAGRIPTADEAKTFLDNTSSSKRTELISTLLNSDGYVSNTFNYWADILRTQSRLQGIRGNAGDPYIVHIKESIKNNTPYDKFVQGLLTASGDTWSKEDGASGFYRRDKGMPLDHMALTMQTFMGTQMACAQCHDHPFDDWTQKEFFQMAAFTSMPQPGRANMGSGMMKMMADTYSEKDKAMRRLLPRIRNRDDPNGRFVGLYLRNVVGYGVPDAGIGVVKLPSDYQYEDAKPGSMVAAETVIGAKVTYNPREASRTKDAPNSREVFADWMVSPENPRFTTVIANRLWKSVTGVGLIEPADDIRSETKASNPELMKFLEQQMIALKYDQKAFLSMLYNTKTYQRKATTTDIDFSKPYYYPGPILQRMSAEQIWDSLLTLKLDDVDAYKNPHNQGPYAEFEKLDAMNADEIIVFVDEVLAELKGKQANPGNIYSTVSKALGAENSYESNSSVAMSIASKLEPEQRKLFAQHGEKLRDLFMKARSAREAGDMEEFRTLSEESMHLRKKIGITPDMMRDAMQKNRKKGGPQNSPRTRDNGNPFARASELPSPAPPGHFLREFGSSDRESIQNANKEATTPQALQLLNGAVDRTLLNDSSSRILTEVNAIGPNAVKKVDHIFLAIYSRLPTPAESEELVAFARADVGDRSPYRDIIWALLNSHEFLFIQ
jgi:hypothetical protein